MTKWRKGNKKAELGRRGELLSAQLVEENRVLPGKFSPGSLEEAELASKESVCHSLSCAEAEFEKLRVRAEIVEHKKKPKNK